MLALLLLLTGCMSSKEPIQDPESVINQVLDGCRSGDYQTAVEHFDGGPNRWKTQPDRVRDFVDRLCTGGQAHSFEVHQRVPEGETHTAIHLTTYKDSQHTEGLRTMTWWFERRAKRWVIVKVE